MRGGHKGLQWCGFAWFLVRFCGKFYFKLRYCGFTKPSSVCDFLMLFCAMFIHISVGFCGVHTPLMPSSYKWVCVLQQAFDYFWNPISSYCGIQGNLRHLKEWDIILQAQKFHRITKKILNIWNGAVIEQRTQQGALPTLISQQQVRNTAKEPAFNLKIHSPIKLNIILNL